MIETVDIEEGVTLDETQSIVHLSEAVRGLRAEARALVPRLKGRTVWMVNSTARGGGVAEMLPRMVTILRELGVSVEWAVIGSSEPRFFSLTKRIHNLIHDAGEADLTAEDRTLYDAVSRENADSLAERVAPGDLLVVHDPQPLGAGCLLRRELNVRAIFRSHIGLDEHTKRTRAAWEFLQPYTTCYDYTVFSAPEYIPDFLAGRAGVIRPGIDPISDKNRELRVNRLVGILCNSRLAIGQHPVVRPEFTQTATRLAPDGRFLPADHSGGIGLLFRPIVTQISRWDRLKGFKPLLDAFVLLKERAQREHARDGAHQRRLQLARLVLAGPDPAAVADDPEATEVLGELVETYVGLPRSFQEDIALVSLPMGIRKDNELIVNALQRCSSIVVQNSLREGFGLTVTEAMWKRAAVLGSRACGIRQQIRDGVDGWLLDDPEDSKEIADRIDKLLANTSGRVRLGESAQRRAHDEFLVFTQVRYWLTALVQSVDHW